MNDHHHQQHRSSWVVLRSYQVNEITSYIDASQVYGSDEALALRLRDTKANLGFLDVSPYINTNDRPRLPDAEAEAFCRSTDRSSRPCFLAGDIRVNENHGKRFNVSKFQRLVFIAGNHLYLTEGNK